MIRSRSEWDTGRDGELQNMQGAVRAACDNDAAVRDGARDPRSEGYSMTLCGLLRTR
jgi:hypothetical protein